MLRNSILLFGILLLGLAATVYAEEFLGAPVIPGAEEVNKTKSRLELKTSLSHDEAMSFYRNTLEGEKDIKFRDWADSTYIEDDGSRPWHSITLSKGGEDGTTVVIMKDNWTWIMGTLLLRFIAVFVVLMILFVAMTVSGKVISGIVRRSQAQKEAK